MELDGMDNMARLERLEQQLEVGWPPRRPSRPMHQPAEAADTTVCTARA